MKVRELEKLGAARTERNKPEYKKWNSWVSPRRNQSDLGSTDAAIAQQKSTLDEINAQETSAAKRQELIQQLN